MANKYGTPKQEFLKSPSNIEQHSRLLEMPSFHRAVEQTKAEYIRRLASMAADPNSPSCASTSAMLFQRMQGVEDFLFVLYNLAEPIQLPPRVPSVDNLEPVDFKKGK